MKFKTIHVDIKPDAIETLSKVSADRALEELIWNALDAEAHQIDVIFYEDLLGGVNKIVVSDDGHGISPEEAEKVFGSIGGSPKRLRRRSPKLDRPYHGKEGRGRYKAFSIGRSIEWHSRTVVNGGFTTFPICLHSGQMASARIGSATNCDGGTGCQVIITDLCDSAGSLRNENRLDTLTYRLAPYLMANPGIRINYDGTPLEVSKSLVHDQTIDCSDEPSTEEETTLQFKVRVLEWTKPRKSTLFLCDSSGVALDEVPIELKGVRFSFTAYVLCDHLRELQDENHLAAGDLNPEVRRFKATAKDGLRDYFRQRQAEEARHVADRIRKEGIYPYRQQPSSPVEKAEQQVFDICAATLHGVLPAFDTADKNSRQFTYRLLREALESSPTNVGRIFQEVLKLTDDQQADLVGLLDKTTLGAILHTAKTVSDRLSFLNGFDQIIHDKTIRKHLKERTQLHRILVEELWLFGDEYTLGSDDVKLKTVLNEHRQLLNLPDLDQQTLGLIADELTDVPDLILWKRFLRGNGDRFENLVIELKRPTVNISLEEIDQVRRYAARVLNNRYFDKDRTHWTFVVLSDGIAADAEAELTQVDREPGHLVAGKHHDIWVREWKEVIHDAKIRLLWIQERLQVAVSDNSEGMQYLQRKFSHLLPDQAKADQTQSDATTNSE